jgi:NADH-quinone oxidoreductase subunit G
MLWKKNSMDVWKRDSACEEKMYHEVEEFICNSCRLTKEVTDWVIEGPRKFDKDSFNQNNYTRELDTVHIATEERNLEGREQDRKKISMPAFPLGKEQEENFKQGNL